ncbi:diguanylate cyclase/phosphodiesterase with PAS/PAC sensor(s) [Shewanella sediminis HAW-EB3]|uniref:Diguanylate cyclase/phosphodiesterase with PAS/PAC sensor(S) n=2 Tax=Shewanella sediminis TaxID=271097 RepID=A8FP86_SHESH|nr:diguanylate cyclase/phosphodiesterase with PAS/PAC sensor(s) [Shewanella sediminis HAW-EB3]
MLLLKLSRPSLVFVVPIFALTLYCCLTCVDFFYERSEMQREAIASEVTRIEQHLIKMQHIVESALVIQDSARIEQEIALAATDFNIMVYTILNQASNIRFANHIVWRNSKAVDVIDGYDPVTHKQVSSLNRPYIAINLERLAVQAYYPLDIKFQENSSDLHDLIYLEYDIAPLINSVNKDVQRSAIRSSAIHLLGLMIFLVLLHFYLVRPLKALSLQASAVTNRARSEELEDSNKPIVSLFSEVAAIQSHLSGFYEKLQLSEKQLNDSQQRWLFAVEVSRNGIWDWNLITDEVFLSDRWKEMLGYHSDELKDELKTWQAMLHPEDKAEALNTLHKYLNGEVEEFESVHRLKHKSGHYIWVLDRGMIVDWDSKGRPVRMIGTHTDVSDDVRNQQAIMHQINHDLLTDLANRRALLDELYRIKEQKQSGSVALFVIDLDNFKMINDALGHHHGDRLLIQVAARLSSYFSNNALIARLSADEFVILAQGLSDDQSVAKRRTMALASQIRQMIGRSFHINNQTLNISASVGICVLDKLSDIDPEQVLQHADLAMHQAKEQGRDAHVVYSADMERVAQNSLLIKSELKNAIELNQLSLVYQPIVDREGEIICAEALLRWQHPEKGNIPPSSFIPVAEGSELIQDIGHWVLSETCQYIKRLQGEDVELGSIAINVSARQFNHDDFVESLLGVIRQQGLGAGSIELELTEYALLTNLDIIRQRMEVLKEAGISIAIDDFGTGYSSLSYLQSLPLSRLKLDAAFVSQIGVNDASNSIVIAIINMAHSLNLQVVAEGVETQQQYEFLLQHDCDTFQGYLFNRPLTADNFIRAVKSGKDLSLQSAG